MSRGSVTNLAAMAGTPRTSVFRGSIASKQIQGLTLEEAKEALLGLFPDDLDYVVSYCENTEAYRDSDITFTLGLKQIQNSMFTIRLATGPFN